MILEDLIKTKEQFRKQVKTSFTNGLKEMINPNEVQAIVVYKLPHLQKVEIERDCDCVYKIGKQLKPNPSVMVNVDNSYDYIFAFRPLKERKDLMELAEAFKKDRDLEYACIPLSLHDTNSFSTTKTFPTEKSVKALIKKYQRINDYLVEVFDSLADELDLEICCDENLVANIFKLT